jgi:hypothetical protein
MASMANILCKNDIDRRFFLHLNLKRDASIGLGSNGIIFLSSLSMWSCNNALTYTVKFSSLVLNVCVVITLGRFDVCGHIAVQFISVLVQFSFITYKLSIAFMF